MPVDPNLNARISSYFSRPNSTAPRSAPKAPSGGGEFSNLPTQWATPLAGKENTSQAPQNVGQWLLNLLSIGTYTGANIGQEYVEGIKQAGEGDPIGGMIRQAAAPVVGAARGLGEGVGMRFDRDGNGDNERPVTWGQNIEDWGGFNWVDEDNGAETFARGAIGTVADIGLDPMTYLTLGAGAAIKGGFKGAGAVIKGAEGAEKNVLSGVVKGAAAERRTTSTANQLRRANAKENRALRTDFKEQIKAGTVSKADLPQIRDVMQRAGVSRVDLTPEVMASVQAGLRAAKNSTAVSGDEIVDVADLVAKTAEAPAPSVAKVAADTPRATDAPVVGGAAASKALPTRDAADALVPKLAGKEKFVPSATEIQSLFKSSLITGKTVSQTGAQLSPNSVAAIARVTESSDVMEGAAAATRTQNLINNLARGADGDILLKATIPIDGATLTGADLLREVSMARLTGNSAPEGYREAFDELISAAAAKPVSRPVFSAAKMSQVALDKYGKTLTGSDIKKFLAAPNDKKMEVLTGIIGGTRAINYSDFAEALNGAALGQLSLSQMRQMAQAVGINVPSRSRVADVRSLLKTEGEFNWAEISAATRTEREVLEDIGVDAADEAAAKAVPLEDVLNKSKVAFAEKIGASSGSRRGEGAQAAIEALGREWAKRADEGTASFDLLSNATMRTIYSAAARQMQKSAHKLSGKDRIPFGDDIIAVTRLVEEWAESMGSFPHIYSHGNYKNVWYVRFSDITDSLGSLAGNALHRPFVHSGKASSTGLSIYPTTLAEGTAVALRLADQGIPPEDIALDVLNRMMKQSKAAKNTFATSSEGRKILANVAHRMSEPDFTRNLLEMHARRKPVAQATLLKTAGDAITPVGEAMIRVLAKNANNSNPSEVFGAIDEGWALATKLRGGKDEGNLMDTVARERLNAGFVKGVLGESGARIFKASTRTARANNPKNAPRSAKEARDASESMQEKLIAHGPGRGPEGAANTARRGQQAKAAEKTLDDAAEIHSKTIDDMVSEGEIADEPLARIEALFELEMAYGNARVFHKLGVGLEGSYGQAELKGLAVAINGNTFRLSGLYSEDMVRWARKIDYEQNPEQVTRWWNALARIPEGVTDDAARTLLAAGARAIPENPLARTAIEPLNADEIEKALELRQFIDVIFAPGQHGLFSRSGVVSSDLADEMGRINFRDGAEKWSKFDVDRGASLADQTGLWRTWGLESTDDPLDVLARFHTAMQATSVKPSVGASIGRHFSHTAEGMTPKEAIAAGWTKMNTTAEGGDLARFIDPDAYFPKEIVKQMTYMENYLNASKRFDGKVGKAVDVYDSILSVLKSSNTLWRPGHHMTNIFGETFMNFMAGVNPMRYAKGAKVMQAGGHLKDADTGPLARYNASNTPAGYTVKQSFDEDATTIVLNIGGKKQIQSIDPGTIWQAALDHSVAITHGLAEDILSPTMARLNPSTSRRALSPLIDTNTQLARFSAARDNIFRITHFVDALEKGQYKTLDEAFRQAAKVVHDYHPTMQTLSAGEQKWARRIVYFYTWQRQAISRVLRTAADRPGLVTMPSKMMYNMAEANGLEPDSFGAPIPDDDRMASYGKEGLLGPSFTGGDTPFSEGDNLWGFSLSAPQIDGIQSLFNGMTMKPEDGIGNVGNVAAGFGDNIGGQLNPLLKAPIELLAGNKMGSGGDVDDVGEYLMSQTGLPSQINTALGNTAKDNRSDEQNSGDQTRAVINMLSGLKFTNYTTPQSAMRAKTEERERQLKLAGLD